MGYDWQKTTTWDLVSSPFQFQIWIFLEFQHMVSTSDDSFLSSNQDTNQFLVEAGIEF